MRVIPSLLLAVLLSVSSRVAAQDQIVYVTSEGSRGRDLILSSPDGNGKTRISQWDGPGHYPHFNWPSWSPAADRLAFMADVDGHDRYSIWTSTRNGEATIRVTPKSTEALYPAWSPDGSQITFTARSQGTWEIFVMNADGGRIARISKHREGGFQPQWGGFPTWAPDGSEIYHHARIRGLYSIHSTSIESGITRPIAWLPSDARYPGWSRSGDWLAFIVSDEGKRSGIYITRKDGVDMRIVTAGDFAGTPAWSPDESAIAITMTEPSYDVAVIKLSSGTIRRIASSTEFEGFPAWIGDTAER